MRAWAAARPVSDSRTTSAGSLISFRIWADETWVAIVASSLSARRGRALGRDGVGGRDGLLDGPRDLARRSEDVVEHGGESGADQTGQHVDRDQLVPVRGAAADRRDQLRSEGTRGVQRRS